MFDEELVNKKYARKKTLLITIASIATVLIVSAGIITVIRNHSDDNATLPTNVTKQVDFTIFYPDEFSKKYHLDKKSVKVADGMLFFDLTMDDLTINITEQPLPELGDIVLAQRDFNKVTIRRGKAYVGMSGERPVVLVSIDKTLISITGGAGVTKDTVVDLAEHMKILE